MIALAPRSLAGIVLAMLGGLAPSNAQVEVWHIGKGGLTLGSRRLRRKSARWTSMVPYSP